MSGIIRPASEDDASAIAELYGPFCESTAVSFEVVAPSPSEIASRIRTITAQHPWLVLDDDGIVAGYVYASRHRERAAYAWCADAAVYVHPAYHRRGVGRSLYTALVQLLRLQGYFKAYAGITVPNRASTRLHEAVGFSVVAVYERVGYKLGAWHDVAWYQLTLQPERPNPSPPVPTAAIAGTPGWTEAVEKGLRHYRRYGASP